MSAEDFVKLSVRYRTDFQFTHTTAHAELLFIRGLAYCGLHNTAGAIPASALGEIGNGLPRPATLAEELVTGDYWETTPLGWCVRSWDKWQHEFDELQERRVRDAMRKREQRRKNRGEAS